ncbi:MAG TPA: hypothetical protein PLF03_03980 [Candidatus Omnitrophota bacterium]|nr:hypothetical protein [Candidatus Omnitrophota bacterium]
MKLRKQELSLLAIWVIIIAAVGIDQGVRHFIGKAGGLDEEISLNEEKFIRLRGILKQEKAVEEQAAKVFAGYKDIQSTDSLLQEVQAVARKIGVNILNVVPSTKNEGGQKVFLIKIESQDDVASVLKFIYTLTEELKGVGVDHVQINAKEREQLPRISLYLRSTVF